jgi:glycosyltransferase involved in cell wall biosynthesis
MPAFNAAHHLEGVIARIPHELWQSIANVWIVNDGSHDCTIAVIGQLCMNNPKIRPVHFSWNRGYGRAVREGLSRCKGDGCDVAVCLHADGQYPPEAISAMVDKMAPVYKYAANRTLTFFENIVFGLSLSDFHSGMLLYSRKALDTLPFERLSASFDFDLEVIALGCARGLAISEMAIPTRYANERSYLNPVSYGVRVLGVMAKFLAGRYKTL